MPSRIKPARNTRFSRGVARWREERRARPLWDEADLSISRRERVFEIPRRVIPRFDRMIAQGIEPNLRFGDPHYMDYQSRIGFNRFREMGLRRGNQIRRRTYLQHHYRNQFPRGLEAVRRAFALPRRNTRFSRGVARWRENRERQRWQRQRVRVPERIVVRGAEPTEQEGNVPVGYGRRRGFRLAQRFGGGPPLSLRDPSIFATPQKKKEPPEISYGDPLEFAGAFKKYKPNPPDDDDYNML